MENVITPELVIFSAELSSLDPNENMKRTKSLEVFFKRYGIHYIKCNGMYKGGSEVSFLVHLTNKFSFDHAKNVAIKQLGQECILFRDKEKKGFLIYANGTTELGIIDRVNIREAKKLGNYTFFPHCGICWAVTDRTSEMP